jgi:hypothetical protein
MPSHSNKMLLGYSALMTALTTVLVGSNIMASSDEKRGSFTELDVERINIVESDGALRMVISNKGRFPGLIWRGKEYEHPNRSTAGVLFFNEESTENGGLIFSGHTDENGVAHSTGHLSFDQYDQDQAFRIFHYQTGDRVRSGMEVSDRPEKPMDMALWKRLTAATTDDERESIVAEAVEAGTFGNEPRAFIGKTPERASEMNLMDAEGRPRITMQVQADGSASISFLDENGAVIKAITPDRQ